MMKKILLVLSAVLFSLALLIVLLKTDIIVDHRVYNVEINSEKIAKVILSHKEADTYTLQSIFLEQKDKNSNKIFKGKLNIKTAGGLGIIPTAKGFYFFSDSLIKQKQDIYFYDAEKQSFNVVASLEGEESAALNGLAENNGKLYASHSIFVSKGKYKTTVRELNGEKAYEEVSPYLMRALVFDRKDVYGFSADDSGEGVTENKANKVVVLDKNLNLKREFYLKKASQYNMQLQATHIEGDYIYAYWEDGASDKTFRYKYDKKGNLLSKEKISGKWVVNLGFDLDGTAEDEKNIYYRERCSVKNYNDVRKEGIRIGKIVKGSDPLKTEIISQLDIKQLGLWQCDSLAFQYINLVDKTAVCYVNKYRNNKWQSSLVEFDLYTGKLLKDETNEKQGERIVFVRHL
ncbi:MAG: hypothetical protein ACRCUS_05330 [Anaerovoracaceae bacterium]